MMSFQAYLEINDVSHWIALKRARPAEPAHH